MFVKKVGPTRFPLVAALFWMHTLRPDKHEGQRDPGRAVAPERV
jgi:hypothetical protein